MLNNTLTDPSNIVEQKKTPNLYLGKKNPNPKQNETSVSLLLYSKYHDFFFDRVCIKGISIIRDKKMDNDIKHKWVY